MEAKDYFDVETIISLGVDPVGFPLTYDYCKEN
jgi:hypothetical protein